MIASLIFAASALVAAPPELDAFFEEFTRKRADIKVLQAEFTEKSITPDETFISEGDLLFAQPRRIVRRTHYPYDSAVVIDGVQSVEYEPEVKQAVRSDLSQVREADILFFGFDADTTRLRENYDVSVFEVKDNPLGRFGLVIKPKAGEAEPPFDTVTLYLTDDTLLPYRLHVVFDAESELQVDMGDYILNGPVAAESTQIRLQEGTKLIENDRVVETVGPEGKLVPEAPAPALSETPPSAIPAPELVEVKPLEEPQTP